VVAPIHAAAGGGALVARQTKEGAAVEAVKLSDIQPDDRNANRGTERGTYMLRRSLEKLGAGRSILLDRHGRIIAGNKTAESAAEIGLDDVLIVRTHGDKLVAVLREVLDLDDPTGQARELAYADNRIGQVSLDFDPAVILSDIEAGVDLSDWWQPFELAAMNSKPPPDEWREYDESAADDVQFHECPECGHKWPK